jgi:hypothetical protein
LEALPRPSQRRTIFRLGTGFVPCLALGLAQLYGNLPLQFYAITRRSVSRGMEELNVVANRAGVAIYPAAAGNYGQPGYHGRRSIKSRR